MLKEGLKGLRLNHLANHLETLLAEIPAKASAMEALKILVEAELLDKRMRQIDSRLKQAKLGQFKADDEYNWTWSKGITQEKYAELRQLHFVTKPENIIFVGNQGVGKTMLAKNLANLAANRGIKTLYTTASRIVLDLGHCESSREMEKCLRKYEKCQLLVIDEIGYQNYDAKAGDFLFEIVNRRYQRTATIFTTNLAFKDWGKVFPGAASVTAMIDRITHHCHIIKQQGESYRAYDSAMQNKGKN